MSFGEEKGVVRWGGVKLVLVPVSVNSGKYEFIALVLSLYFTRKTLYVERLKQTSERVPLHRSRLLCEMENFLSEETFQQLLN